MCMESDVKKLWKECKEIFLSVKNDELEIFFKNIIEIVKKNYSLLKKCADYTFLNHIIEMDYRNFVIGTNGDDYEKLVKIYCERKNILLEDVWCILAQLIWDLSVPVTTEICPFCHCDNVVILVDKTECHLYESCENCFRTLENGIQVIRPKDLFPANRVVLTKHHLMSRVIVVK